LPKARVRDGRVVTVYIGTTRNDIFLLLLLLVLGVQPVIYYGEVENRPIDAL